MPANTPGQPLFASVTAFRVYTGVIAHLMFFRLLERLTALLGGVLPVRGAFTVPAHSSPRARYRPQMRFSAPFTPRMAHCWSPVVFGAQNRLQPRGV